MSGSFNGRGKCAHKSVGHYSRRNSAARHHASKSLDGLLGRGVEAAAAGFHSRRYAFAPGACSLILD
jgi:hypothetical protein